MKILNMKGVFRKILRDLIFDTSCSCCLKNLDRDGFICSSCLIRLKDVAFLKNSGNFYFSFYYEEKIRRIISDYKIRNRKNLANDLAFIIRDAINILIKKENIDIIIPVPINKNRLKERGFNQVEYILDVLKIDYLKIERVKNTKHMYKLKNLENRRNNIKNAFKLDIDLTNKKILLIDDIVTTGATIYEIVDEIKKFGNADIKIFSIAISKKFTEKLGDNNGNLHR